MMSSRQEPVRNLDKREARRVHKQSFSNAVNNWRARHQSNCQASRKQVGATDVVEWGDHEGVKVFIRKRPLLDRDISKKTFDSVSILDQGSVVVHDGRMKPDMKSMFFTHHRFNFGGRSLDETWTNADVHEEIGDPLIRSLVHRHHRWAEGIEANPRRSPRAAVLMFGQTGSGKTFTIEGLFENAAKTLFERASSAHGDHPPFCHVQAAEVLGSNATDLLAVAEDGRVKVNKAVRILEDESGDVHLRGASTFEASTPEELTALLTRASSRRHQASTGVHDVSSRAHGCYVITLDGDGGRLALIDLAGTEWNWDSFKHDPARSKECAEINMSLMALKECVAVLGRQSQADNSAQCHAMMSNRVSGTDATNATERVPFRSSKLTHLLKPYLSGHESQVSMIVSISPASGDVDHTVSSLRLAAIMDLQVSESKQQQQKGGKQKLAQLDCEDVWDEDVVDVVVEKRREAMRALDKPLQKWTAQEVAHWWTVNTAKGKILNESAKTPNMDGKAFARLPVPRFVTLCGGDKEMGEFLYKKLRKEMEDRRKEEQEKRMKVAAAGKSWSSRG